MNRAIVSRRRVFQQLGSLGVMPGAVLVVHTSFRAVRPVEDGLEGLIAALRQAVGPDGTLVMPTMTGSRKDEPFDPAVTPTRNMGIVAESFWRMPGVRRSDHPTSSFAANGPLSREITASQPLEPVHGLDSPIGRVFQHHGLVLLLGVDHTANTTIHLAEALSRVPYGIRKWATILQDGHPRRVAFRETDHCCRSFQHVDGWLRERGLQREGQVGHAHARLVRAHDIVDVVTEHLAADTTMFLCPRGISCEECDAAWQSIGS